MKIINKGISLISLIITVLVIAILAAVMVPSGVDKINNAKLTAFNDNIMILKQEASSYSMQNGEYPIKVDDNGNLIVYSIATDAILMTEATKKGDQSDTFYIIDLDKLKLDNKDNGVGKTIDDYYILAKSSGNVYYAKGIKIGNVTYYTKQDKGDGVVAVAPTSAPIPNGAFDGNLNAPKLSAGMTAVKWNGSAWVDADKSNKGNDWYDYTQGINKWANAKLVDGSMLVWIPRYTYKIISGEHTSTAGVIDVRFSIGTKDNTLDGYRIHPTFYWGEWNIPASAPMTKVAGGIELTGIWIGKFESSSVNGQQDASGDKIAVKPNVSSWNGLTIGEMFTKCREMQTKNSTTYGISNDSNIIDTHIIKNSEWGAVAYLSKYARGAKEVGLNENSSLIGGNGDYIMYKDLSTTGTEYGIYDMNGSSWEYVGCYIKNGNSSLNTYGSTLVNANAKYKDIFPVAGTDNGSNNYNLTDKAYGHAFWETSPAGTAVAGWFEDHVYFMELDTPFPIRGGYYDAGSAGGMFYVIYNDGSASSDGSWRISVVVP